MKTVASLRTSSSGGGDGLLAKPRPRRDQHEEGTADGRAHGRRPLTPWRVQLFDLRHVPGLEAGARSLAVDLGQGLADTLAARLPADAQHEDDRGRDDHRDGEEPEADAVGARVLRPRRARRADQAAEVADRVDQADARRRRRPRSGTGWAATRRPAGRPSGPVIASGEQRDGQPERPCACRRAAPGPRPPGRSAAPRASRRSLVRSEFQPTNSWPISDPIGGMMISQATLLERPACTSP